MPKQYKVTPGFLVEMPRMEKPFCHPFGDYTGDRIAADRVADQWERYNQHLASLQRIPIAANVSFEGEIINEDQFEMREVFHHDSPRRKVSYAYPKQPEGKEKGFYTFQNNLHKDVCTLQSH